MWILSAEEMRATTILSCVKDDGRENMAFRTSLEEPCAKATAFLDKDSSFYPNENKTPFKFLH